MTTMQIYMDGEEVREEKEQRGTTVEKSGLETLM